MVLPFPSSDSVLAARLSFSSFTSFGDLLSTSSCFPSFSSDDSFSSSPLVVRLYCSTSTGGPHPGSNTLRFLSNGKLWSTVPDTSMIFSSDREIFNVPFSTFTSSPSPFSGTAKEEDGGGGPFGSVGFSNMWTLVELLCTLVHVLGASDSPGAPSVIMKVVSSSSESKNFLARISTLGSRSRGPASPKAEGTILSSSGIHWVDMRLPTSSSVG
mmetsp:Transcript_7511/g.11938  ORF Transcript_7511/g.11938 Transcript_7511/m.11938 type:complete len:213 (+) Transcript_7511:895-1533(+)